MISARPYTIAPTSVALATLVTAASLLAAVTIDPSKGKIDGKSALSVWPRVGNDTVDPAGYEGVLVRTDDPGVVYRIPAGKWTLPPTGRYQILLEGKQCVSAYPTNLEWYVHAFNGRGAALKKECGPAGVVRLAAVCPTGNCRSWTLHETSNIQPGTDYFSPLMLRERPIQRAVLMPPGRVVVALYDFKHKAFKGLTAPVEVVAGQPVTARPAAPKPGRSALVLRLLRPTVQKRPDDDVTISLVHSNNAIAPAAFVARTHNHLIAVWPDVAADAGRIEVKSTRVKLAQQKTVQLRSGVVEHTEGTLVPLAPSR